MLINGVLYENITCPQCKHRHPKEFSCSYSAEVARRAKDTRQQGTEVEENGEYYRTALQDARLRELGIYHVVDELREQIIALRFQVESLQAENTLLKKAAIAEGDVPYFPGGDHG